jgi:hypothetical protein
VSILGLDIPGTSPLVLRLSPCQIEETRTRPDAAIRASLRARGTQFWGITSSATEQRFEAWAVVVAWPGGLSDHRFVAGRRDDRRGAGHQTVPAAQSAIRKGAMAQAKGSREGAPS